MAEVMDRLKNIIKPENLVYAKTQIGRAHV